MRLSHAEHRRCSPCLDNIETSHKRKNVPNALVLFDFSIICMYIDELKKYKVANEQIIEIFERSDWLKKHVPALKNCGTSVGFDIDENGEIKLKTANFCRKRLCPMCQRRKSLKVYGEIMRMTDYLGGKYACLHLVLSRPNVYANSLTNEITRLFKGSSSFFAEKSLKRAFKGVLRCLEVTYNAKRGDFHPHLHCLVFVNRSYFTSRDYLKHSHMVSLWQKYVGAPADVYVRKVDDIAHACAEVAKYCTKPMELNVKNPEKITEIYEILDAALHSRRLLQSYGVVKSALADLKIDLEELTEEYDTQNIKMWFRWNGGEYVIEK